jgi:hypothetical protein
MTKSEEMQRYDEFLRTLPQDSYLKPWLTDIRDQVETDLRNDIIPELTPRETYHQCQQLRKEADIAISKEKDQASMLSDRLLAAARNEAKRITDAAEAEAEEIRRTFRSQLHTLSRALSAVA